MAARRRRKTHKTVSRATRARISRGVKKAARKGRGRR